MMLDEAKKVAKIVATADSHCPSCIGDLVDKLNEAFPFFTWEMLDNNRDWPKVEVRIKK